MPSIPPTHTHTMHCIILCINWTYQHTSYLQGLLRLPRAISVLFTLASDNHTRSPTSSATLPKSSMSVREAQPWTEWIKAGSQSPNKQLTGPLESPDRGHTRFFRTPLDKGSIGSDRSANSKGFQLHRSQLHWPFALELLLLPLKISHKTQITPREPLLEAKLRDIED